MDFANPWGLLGLLSLPLITAIHLFQRRFPPLLVGGAHLWGAQTRMQTSGRRRDRLPVTPTLLLELLAGLIFSLALAQPRIGEMSSVAHLAVVLDDSASMSGQPLSEANFREAAATVIGDRVAALGRDARVTLIRSGLQPTLLGDRAMDWEAARQVLSKWHPQSPKHDFSPAWDEASRVVGPDGQSLFLTDRLDDETESWPVAMEAVSVGRQLVNVSVSAARWTVDTAAGTGRVFVRVSNHSPESRRGTLTAVAQDQTLLQEAVTLAADSSAPWEVTVPAGIGQLTLAIDFPGDGLAVDDRVTLVEPQSRLLRVAVTLAAQTPEWRLTHRVLAAIPDVQLDQPETSHLLIGPASDPPQTRSDQWWCGIGPLNAAPQVRKQAKDLVGPYLVEKQHPLLAGVVLGGVVWGGAQPTDLPLRPLISAGRIPLFGHRDDLPVTAYVLNIDLGRSNLGESPDWPILMTNLVERRRDQLAGLRQWNYQVGETVTLRAPASAAGRAASALSVSTQDDAHTLRMLAPSGAERVLIRDRSDVVEIGRLDEVGVYRLVDGDQAWGEFAVNFFDDRESRSVGVLAPGERPPQAPPQANRLMLDSAYSWLMALALLLLMGTLAGDWLVLRARQTTA